ncbi:MAG TPA: YeeE/YedE thiosulfate transporter family protein [Vicinamibacterales bacterium]
MNLLLTGQPPLHWALAGLGIAGVTIALLFIANRRLGVSTGLEDLCALVVRAPYFARDERRQGRVWRLPFLAGLVAGGLVSASLGAGWRATWDLGAFDAVVGLGPAGKTAWMFVGGLCIGFGTRLAGGCTSGHGIFGLANLERPSLVATTSFMLGGVLTTQLVHRVFFPLAGGR